MCDDYDFQVKRIGNWVQYKNLIPVREESGFWVRKVTSITWSWEPQES